MWPDDVASCALHLKKMQSDGAFNQNRSSLTGIHLADASDALDARSYSAVCRAFSKRVRSVEGLMSLPARRGLWPRAALKDAINKLLEMAQRCRRLWPVFTDRRTQERLLETAKECEARRKSCASRLVAEAESPPHQ